MLTANSNIDENPNTESEESQGKKIDYSVRMTREEREDLGREIKHEIQNYISSTDTRRG